MLLPTSFETLESFIFIERFIDWLPLLLSIGILDIFTFDTGYGESDG
jgi:hypothetical protein